MRAPLSPPVAGPHWPAGVDPRPWRDGDAPAVHALLVEAYRNGGGEVEPYVRWLPWFTGDAEFDPAACTLAWSGDELAGVALCWSSAFVKDLCVADAHRRRGLGEALLRHSFALFAARGVSALDLKVDSENPSGAVRLYERVGFEVVERIPNAF
jgi:ribosomal protein S18 acetylase RimI-like enzyme